MATSESSRTATSTTVPTDADVGDYLASVDHDVRRRDALTLVDLMQRVTGEPPRMWGPSIVGFGTYHYAYESGREGDTGAIAFSPRKASTTVYFNDGFDAYGHQLARLGPHTLGRSCLYLKDLSKVDLGVLEQMIRRSYEVTTARSAPPAEG